LQPNELLLLHEACEKNWSKINPAIFGTLFQSSMNEEQRHREGAHYTHEADIQRVVRPTIVRPWRERMAAARTLRELREIRADLLKFKVLDPACGSGNFLYVAYRELKRFELDLLERVHAEFAEESRLLVGSEANLSVRQFYGIDKEPFAVELAKVTMMLARQLALTEVHSRVDAAQGALPLEFGASLPLENLKENIKKDDALFCKWESVNAIVGNPPYQSKNKMVRSSAANTWIRFAPSTPAFPAARTIASIGSGELTMSFPLAAVLGSLERTRSGRTSHASAALTISWRTAARLLRPCRPKCGPAMPSSTCRS
jgi:type II restriction/modification system DNA methylase subunit YeeA